MLDLRFVRENGEQVTAALSRRGMTFDLTEFLSLDARRRTAQQEIETLRRTRNDVSEEIGRLKKAGQHAEDKVVEMRAVGDTIAALENSTREVEEAQRNILLTIPNLPHASVPVGSSADENVEVRRVGEPRKFDFPAKDHVDVGTGLELESLLKDTYRL